MHLPLPVLLMLGKILLMMITRMKIIYKVNCNGTPDHVAIWIESWAA